MFKLFQRKGVANKPPLKPYFNIPKSKTPDILASVIPDQQDWDHAHKLFDHTKKCNCSTCVLSAKLSKAIRGREI